MNKKLTSAAGLLAAIALVGVTAPTASAAGQNTTATFSLVGGSLNVSVPATADLGTASSGATLVSGSLGTTQVSDNRGLILGWQTSAASTGFTGDGGTQSLAVTYSAGTVTKTGTVTAVSAGVVPLTSIPVPVVAGTLAVGNNSASWNPSISVTLPPESLTGTYTGTITTSVA